MSEFVEHKDFNDALESFKKEHPDCRIETFSGTTQQIIDGFNIKEYPFLVDRSFPIFLIKVGREELVVGDAVEVEPAAHEFYLRFTGNHPPEFIDVNPILLRADGAV